MPAFRLVVERSHSAPFRHLGPSEAHGAFDRFDFVQNREDQALRSAVLTLTQAGHSCLLLEQRKWKAAFFDMDSTVIAQESIVELARAAGREEEVAAMTERAMAGELDFSAALRARVQLLKGVPTSVLETVAKRLTINPGMHAFAEKARAKGIKLFLISGGFRPLAAIIARQLHFDGFDANDLAIDGAVFTGELEGPIVDGTAKASYLERQCQTLNINPREVFAVGDGANDLPMIHRSGAGVGYFPKAILLPHLHGAIFHDHSLLIQAFL